MTAAETVDGVNKMLLLRTGQAHYWNLSTDWKYQQTSSFYSDGTDGYYNIESQFSLDMNNDGVVGKPAPTLTFTPIEQQGSVTLNKDSQGRLYANDNAILNWANGHIDETLGAGGGWEVTAAETVDGVNKMLLLRTGQAHYWNLSTDWKYQQTSSFYSDGTDGYYNIESQFSLDMNNDGVVGKPAPTLTFTPIEQQGSVTLNKDSQGRLYANDNAILNWAKWAH